MIISLSLSLSLSLFSFGRSFARWDVPMGAFSASLRIRNPDVVPFAVVNLSAATHFYVYLLAIMVSLVYIRRADCDLTRWQTVCTDCGGTVIEYDTAAGNGFCVQCGTVVEENTIVNEVRSNVMQYVCNI